MFRFSCLCIASLLFLALFAQNAAAQSQGEDEQQIYLSKLFTQMEHVMNEFRVVYTRFEVLKEDSVKQPNTTEARAVFVAMKDVKTKMVHSQTSFEDFLARFRGIDLIVRVGVEAAKIKHQIYVKVVEQILFEILAKSADVTELRLEEPSAELKSVIELLEMKYNNIKTAMLDIDQRLHQLETSNGLGNLLNEIQILDDLTKVIKELQATRSGLSLAFLTEINRIDGEGKTLDKIQRAETDVFLALVVWFEGYATHYVELLQKIVGNSKV